MVGELNTVRPAATEGQLKAKVEDKSQKPNSKRPAQTKAEKRTAADYSNVQAPLSAILLLEAVFVRRKFSRFENIIRLLQLLREHNFIPVLV